MTDYNKTTNFTAKDTLPSGNSSKIVKGTELDAEFNAIASASATKYDSGDGYVYNALATPEVVINNISTSDVNWTTPSTVTTLDTANATAAVFSITNYALTSGAAQAFYAALYLAKSGQSGAPPAWAADASIYSASTVRTYAESTNAHGTNVATFTVALDTSQDFQYAIDRSGVNESEIKIMLIGYYA